jgi:hypothetical protein
VRRVAYLDSLGVTLLAQSFAHARERGVAVAVICDERTAELFETLGLDAEVAIVQSRDQALAMPVPAAPSAEPEPAAEPPYRATLRAARELVQSGAVPPDDEELTLLRRSLEEAPPPAAG